MSDDGLFASVGAVLNEMRGGNGAAREAKRVVLCAVVDSTGHSTTPYIKEKNGEMGAMSPSHRFLAKKADKRRREQFSKNERKRLF